jgi:hypothetical protein
LLHKLSRRFFSLPSDNAPGHARTGGENVTTTAKLFANCADIDRFIFRAHANAHFSIS